MRRAKIRREWIGRAKITGAKIRAFSGRLWRPILRGCLRRGRQFGILRRSMPDPLETPSQGLLGEALEADFARMSHARAPVWDSAPEHPGSAGNGTEGPLRAFSGRLWRAILRGCLRRGRRFGILRRIIPERPGSAGNGTEGRLAGAFPRAGGQDDASSTETETPSN